jgi:hypothetical protein
MRALEKEKAKLQEQIKELELSQHPTTGESSGQSSISDQVVQGALETIKRMPRQG